MEAGSGASGGGEGDGGGGLGEGGGGEGDGGGGEGECGGGEGEGGGGEGGAEARGERSSSAHLPPEGSSPKGVPQQVLGMFTSI